MAQPTAIQMDSATTRRRAAVAAFAATGRKPTDIARALADQGIVNPANGKPYSRQTIRQDLRQAGKHPPFGLVNGPMRSRPVAETIQRWTYTKPQYQVRSLLHVDSSWIDYGFWDALRRGYAPGYELSGPALCMATAQTIASYAYGKGFNASLIQASIPTDETKHTSVHEAALIEANGKPTQNLRNAEKTTKQPGMGKPTASPLQLLPKAKPSPNASDRVAWTNLQLNTCVETNMPTIVRQTVDMYCLGNVFWLVNPDCSFSILSPETVTLEYDAADYRRVVRAIIRTKQEKSITEDIYTAEKRTVTVQYHDERGTQTREYENLIGRIPLVHWANDRSANEIWGRPVYEGQLPLLRQFDDLLLNMIEGVKLLGTPIPTFENLDNPRETRDLNCDEVQYTDADGNTKSEFVMRLDKQTGLFIGKGGQAKMLSTQVGFTKDSIDAKRECFLMYLNGVRIPEVIWGGALQSSKASADAQMPPFIQYIQFRRLMLEGQGANPALGIEARGGLQELFDIWLRMYKLLNPDIVVGPVQISWPEIDLYGDQTKYLWYSFMKGVNAITDETLVRGSGYVDDPAGEVRAAAGQKGRNPAFDEYDARLRAARLKALQAQNEPLDDSGKPFTTDWVQPLIDQGQGKIPMQKITGEPNNPGKGQDITDQPMTIGGAANWPWELT